MEKIGTIARQWVEKTDFARRSKQMPDKESIRLGGLWKRETRNGKTLWEGTFEVTEIEKAMSAVAKGGVVQITIWENKAEDKRSERSPDGSLVMAEKWEKPNQSRGATGSVKPQAEPEELTEDDIPF
jgi:hypothetical protein